MATTGAKCISEEIAARQSVNDNLYKFDHPIGLAVHGRTFFGR
jgi:hypothetical protein